MARKRPAKRRKQSQKVVNHPKQDIASPVDASPSIQSPTRRSSDDDALTEDTMSDGNQTLMTSPMNTDEDASADPITVNTATTSEPDTDDHDVEDDAISIYPRSHYPQVAFEHRTEEPYQGTGPRYGGSDMGASTRSLWEQDLDYRELFGRRYCRDYYMPNDDLEQLRMALIHQVFLHVLNHELTMAPLEDPKHILDVGTGTGEWAIRMAELHPTCEVVGTDISAIAETKGVPMNVFFEIEDAEEWERLPDLYDLIHFRGTEGAFEDWNLMYENVFYSLKPGGYIEIQDFDTVDGLDGFMSTFGPESVVYSLQRDLAIASEKSGRRRGISHLKPEYLNAAGFEDVNITPYDIPITVAEKTAGKIWLIACLDAFEAMCLRLLTEYMEWDPDDCKAACEEAARELANLAKDPEKSEGLAVKMVVLTARKPLDAPPAKAPPGAISSSASMQSHMDDTPGPDAPEMSRQTSPIAVESRKSREAQESLPP